MKTSGAMPHHAPQDGMSLVVAVQAGAPAGLARGAWTGTGRTSEPSAVEQAATSTTMATIALVNDFSWEMSRSSKAFQPLVERPPPLTPEPCHVIPGTSASVEVSPVHSGEVTFQIS
ncbi:hypothetical protein ACFQ0B_18550 [Nonomuraea thailandensis]